MSVTTVRHLEREGRALRAQLDEALVSAREAYRAGWEAGRAAAVAHAKSIAWADREQLVTGLRDLVPPVSDTEQAP